MSSETDVPPCGYGCRCCPEQHHGLADTDYKIANEVVPRDELMETTEKYAEDVLEGSPSPSAPQGRFIKGRHLSVAEAMASTFPGQAARLTSEDAIEGPRTFAEKRWYSPAPIRDSAVSSYDDALSVEGDTSMIEQPTAITTEILIVKYKALHISSGEYYEWDHDIQRESIRNIAP